MALEEDFLKSENFDANVSHFALQMYEIMNIKCFSTEEMQSAS